MTENLHELPGHLIRRVHQISTALFAEECSEFGLTPVQYGALATIGAHPEIDATRVAQLIAFDRSTIGDVLERLEAKGWIRRTPSPADRRVKLLHITQQGEQLIRAAMPAIRRVQDRLLQPLAPADRAALLRLLRQLADVHDEVSPVRVRGAEQA